jgi:putative transport protein
MEIFSNSYFALFVIIALGYLVGRVKIKGLSLDVSAIIFVALIFGHYGVVIPRDFQNLGLVLFIFTIGVQAGPGFFESFKKDGRKLALFATLLIVLLLCLVLWQLQVSESTKTLP